MNSHVQRLAYFGICSMFAFTVGCSHHHSGSNNGGQSAKTTPTPKPTPKPEDTQNINGSTATTDASGQTASETANKQTIAAAAGVTGALSTSNQIASGFSVAPTSAAETNGGRLLTRYLLGTMTGPAVVDSVFSSTQKAAVERELEISFLVNKLRASNRFSDDDQQKVQLLEQALNKRMIENIQFRDSLDTYLKWGTAIAVGGAGAYFAPSISRGVVRLVSAPARGVSAATRTVRGWLSKEPAAAARAAAATPATEATSDAAATAAETVAGAKGAEESADRVAGQTDQLRTDVAENVRTESASAHHPPLSEQPIDATAKLEISPAAAKELSGVASETGAAAETANFAEAALAKQMAHVLDSPDLEQGLVVSRIPTEEVASVTALNYAESGMIGTAVHRVEGQPYFIARVKTEAGHEYFRINGREFETRNTLDGKIIKTSAEDVVNMVQARMNNWASMAENFDRPGEATAARRSSRTEYMRAKAYQLANSELGRSALQRTAVGTTTGLLTLWGLSTVDTKYFTVDDYTKALAKQGIKLDELPNELRTNLQSRAKIPATVPEAAQ